MFRAGTALLVPLALLVFSTRGSAEFILTANMTNAAENPPATPLLTTTGEPRPTSFGTATFVLNDDQTALTFSAVVNNIDFGAFRATPTPQTPDTNDDITNAHIHGPAGPNMNTGVIWGFIGAPFNDTDPTNVVVTPFPTGVGAFISGAWDLNEGNNNTDLTTWIPSILAGNTYINFHTRQFGGGEIRGQIVPEPASLVLTGLGLAGLYWHGRRRCRTATAM